MFIWCVHYTVTHTKYQETLSSHDPLYLPVEEFVLRTGALIGSHVKPFTQLILSWCHLGRRDHLKWENLTEKYFDENAFKMPSANVEDIYTYPLALRNVQSTTKWIYHISNKLCSILKREMEGSKNIMAKASHKHLISRNWRMATRFRDKLMLCCQVARLNEVCRHVINMAYTMHI